jgi:toxin-antitoxin system PIN domain toxin
MTILDANVLLYAYNADMPQQRAVKQWLTKRLRDSEPIGLPWITLWAFIRISTNSRIWKYPKSPTEVSSIVHEWLSETGVVVVQPGPRHADILEWLVRRHAAVGALVTDAALAALAM